MIHPPAFPCAPTRRSCLLEAGRLTGGSAASLAGILFQRLEILRSFTRESAAAELTASASDAPGSESAAHGSSESAAEL